MQKKRAYLIAVSVAGISCLLMVIFPSIALLSAQKGISLWAGSVLPALLPFFICANFMNDMGITRRLPPAAFVFSMSVMSGYPMGAKLIGDMSKAGVISSGQARHMVSFCSTSGPAFMVGAVGVSMLGGVLPGIVVACSHYAGALCNGLVFKLILPKEKKHTHVAVAPVKKTSFLTKGIPELFADAAFSSFRSLGVILAYIVFFMFVTDVLQFAGVFSFFETISTKALCKGFFEMTVGCASLSLSQELSLAMKCVLCSVMVSFSGLSVIGQSLSMLSGSGVKMPYFVVTKLFHSIFAGVIALLMSEMLL